jgi:hypothetical protein
MGLPPTVPSLNRNPFYGCVPVFALICLVILVASQNSKQPSNIVPVIQKQQSTFTKAIKQGTLRPKPSIAGTSSIHFYHCNSIIEDTKYSIILLHGKSFTKEDWKRVGILGHLCAIPSASVTALDFTVRASGSDVKQILDLLAANRLASLPVTALVTPSASGAGVLDWITTAATQHTLKEIPKLIQTWIPVASNSVMNADGEALRQIAHLDGFSILALYGDQDLTGKKSMVKLGQLAGADVKVQHGRHPCYIDSPDQFVETILNYLNIPRT